MISSKQKSTGAGAFERMGAPILCAAAVLLAGCTQGDVKNADTAFHTVAQGTHNVVKQLPVEASKVKHETTHNLDDHTGPNNLGHQIGKGAVNIVRAVPKAAGNLAHAAASQ